jgi:amino acid transporter
MMALCLAAFLFIAQTYIAALLVPDRTAFVGEDATNDASYAVSALVGGPALRIVTAVALALSAAIANALVAQAATARLLFAMARDGQLPRVLAHVHPVRRVPERAVMFVAAVNLILGVFFVGQVALLSSLVNFRALFSFLLLHVSVIVYFLIKRRTGRFACMCYRRRSGSRSSPSYSWPPTFMRKTGGLVWLAIGTAILIGLRLAGRAPELNLEA